MRQIQTLCAVTETIGSGDDCPLKHQCYHFTSRGFLPRVPRAFHPPRRREDEFPRIVEVRCTSRNRLLLQAKKTKQKHGVLVTGTMRNDWLCTRIRALHRNLVRIIPWQLPEREERAESWAGYSGRLYDLLSKDFQTLHPQPKITVRLLRWPVTQCVRISHLQVEWMQHFIHKRKRERERGTGNDLLWGNTFHCLYLLIWWSTFSLPFMSRLLTESFEWKGSVCEFVCSATQHARSCC